MSEFCNYELIGELGRGGMGTVYRARHSDGQVVALKVMRPELRGNLSAEARFRRAPKLYPQHPNIVAIYDAGECKGTLYFAMQLIEGESLAGIVKRAHNFAPEQYLPVLRDVAAALDAAHARGVIHRDIKPSNILIRASDGRAILTDFDIAKDLAATQFTSVGATGQMIGTAHYMSPEQAGGKPITPASDVYALGAMTYEVLAGRPPFVGESEFAVARMHLQDAPVDLHKVNPNVPAALSAVVMRALRKDPSQRYQSAGAFAQAYAQVIEKGRKAIALPRTFAIMGGLAALLVIAALGVAVISSTQQDNPAAGGATSIPAHATATGGVATQAVATLDSVSATPLPTQASPTPVSSPTAPGADQPTSTLAAGAGEQTQTPAPTDAPTHAAPPNTPTTTDTPAPTNTPKPTPKPKPTKTKTPTPTPTPTYTPTPTPHIIILTLRVPPIRITLRPLLLATPTP